MLLLQSMENEIEKRVQAKSITSQSKPTSAEQADLVSKNEDLNKVFHTYTRLELSTFLKSVKKELNKRADTNTVRYSNVESCDVAHLQQSIIDDARHQNENSHRMPISTVLDDKLYTRELARVPASDQDLKTVEFKEPKVKKTSKTTDLAFQLLLGASSPREGWNEHSATEIMKKETNKSSEIYERV